MTDQPCLHCKIVELIEAEYPGGIDKDDMHFILIALGVVAGDLLAGMDSASVEGFVEVVEFRRRTSDGASLGAGTKH